MATLRQKRLAEEIVKSAKSKKKVTANTMLVNVGYAKSVAEHKPAEILDAKGVQEELENLGFDVESAKKVVKSILIKGREENRLKAAQEIFKVQGEYAPEKHLVLTKKIVSIDG